MQLALHTLIVHPTGLPNGRFKLLRHAQAYILQNTASYQTTFTVIHTTRPCVFFPPENVSDSHKRSTNDFTGKKRLSHLLTLLASVAILQTVINAGNDGKQSRTHKHITSNKKRVQSDRMYAAVTPARGRSRAGSSSGPFQPC